MDPLSVFIMQFLQDDCSNLNETDPLYPMCSMDYDYSTELNETDYVTDDYTEIEEDMDYYNEEQRKTYNFLLKRVIFLAPVIIITLIIMFMERRKSACLKCCWGHFALIIPANFIEVRHDRLTIIAAFGATAIDVADMLTEKEHFTVGQYPLVKVLIRMGLVMLTCLLCLPLLICFTAGSYTSLILGIMYGISYITVRVTEDIATITDDFWCAGFSSCIREVITIMFGLIMLYGYIRKVYLKIIKRPPKPTLRSFQRKYLKLLVTSRNRLQMQAAADHKLAKLKGKCTSWCESRIYYKTKGFRYSLSILISITIGMTLVTVYIGETFEEVICVDMFILQIFDDFPENLLELFKGIPVSHALLKISQRLFKMDLKIEFEINLFEFIYDQYRIIIGAMYAAVSVTYVLLIIAVLHMLRSYKENVLSLQRRTEDNHLLGIKTMGNVNVVVCAIQYCGFQVAYLMSGVVVQVVVSGIMFIILSEAVILPLKYAYWSMLLIILNRIYPILVVIILIKGTQRLLVKYVFLQEKGELLALDNRKGFYNMMYFMFFYNIFMGFISCLLRIIKTIIFGIWFLPRLDRSIFPKTFEHLDSGFKAYTCLLKLEAIQSNAIVIGFTNILLKRGIFGMSGELSENNALSHIQINKPIDKRRMLARNRWFVTYTLLRNPQLIEKRGSNPFEYSDEQYQPEFSMVYV